MKRFASSRDFSNDEEPTASSSSSGEEEEEEDEDPAVVEVDRQRRLAALEKLQSAYLAEALPGFAGSSKAGGNAGKASKGKSVWEMDDDDFEDEEDDSEEESEGDDDMEDDEEEAPVVIAFAEPRLGGSDAPVASGSRDMRNFMSAKVKNSKREISVADLANSKLKGKSKAVPMTALDEEEESHLSTLDGHLASLIRPLTAPSSSATSQLPQLLSSLPLAPTKALKGHTPLPKNVPRTLRRGQEAANLRRAQERDRGAGVLAGQKRGREATSLKEKRREDGTDKRERGLKGAVGRMEGAELKISKKDIARINGGGGERRSLSTGSSRGKGGGGRGGKKGGGGKKRR